MNLHQFFIHGPPPPSAQQVASAIDEYERFELQLGDDPSAIADCLGWTRGTGAVIRRMSRERRAA
jgi:hypothetical protein